MQRIAVDYRLTRPIALNAAFEIRGFTALLGRSGAGKTSLLKALAGLIPADGAPWHGLAPAARPVGYLPQDIALFPHLTALQNAAYALRGRDRLLRAQTLLDSLGAGHLAARPATTLSGGEAQRVALARALARNPALLLLDEPSAALDGATRDLVLARLIASIADHNIPALAATHDPAIAALADHLAILANGGIIRQGTPREVFNDPQTTEAASLLGYQNIWQSNGSTHAIRAEDVELAVTGVPAIIKSCREQADLLRIECAAPHPMVVLLRNADQANFKPGQEIHLHFPSAKLKILPP